MGKLVVLEEFLREKTKQAREAELFDRTGMKPTLEDGDILSRDYADFQNVVFGLLKIREVMSYWRQFSEEWKHYLLDCLDAAFNNMPDMPARIMDMKRYITEETDVMNQRDMANALLILDLIEKAPSRRARL